MDTETISGLHKCQPKNEPIQGDVKNMVVLNMPAKGEKKAWIKIKSEQPEKGGSPYRILNVEKLPWEPDQYGNIAFNLEVEATTAQPSAFQQTKATVKQGERSYQPGIENEEGHRSADIRDKGLHGRDPDWPDAPTIAPEPPPAGPAKTYTPISGDGVQDARKHLMQSANLLVLCIRAAEKAVAPHQPVVAQTSEQFQSDVAKLFIEASGRRTTDGVHWWSYIDKMPETPIQ